MRTIAIALGCLLLAACDVYLDPTYRRYLAESLMELADDIPAHDIVMDLAASGDRRDHLAAAASSKVIAWDRSGAREPWSIHPPADTRHLSMTGDTLGVVCAEGRYTVAQAYDLGSRALVGSVETDHTPMGFEFLGDDTTFFLAENDPPVYRLAAYHRPEGQAVFVLDEQRSKSLDYSMRSMVGCAVRQWLAVTDDLGTIRVYDFSETPAAEISFRPDGRFQSLAFNADCTRLAALRMDGKLDVFDTAAAAPASPLATIEVEGIQYGARLAFSPDGELLAVSMSLEGAVGVEQPAFTWIYDWARAEPIFEARDGGCVYGLVFEADGRRLASVNDNHIIKLWDVDLIRADAGR
ncbi:MAG: WD40 repeat domain-containing protein [Deltaproteobacteria bacterium]|nr:WD40 repeat domain-containing protein [Deltaproteobacteria bacterium]